MGTAIADKPRQKNQTDPFKLPEWALPITPEVYHRMAEYNLIPDKTELLEGVVAEKMPKSPLHVFITQKLFEFFFRSLPVEYSVRQESPIRIQNSEPEPDIAVVKGGPDDYLNEHPATAEVVIEVSISTEKIDEKKKYIYARAGVSTLVVLYPTEERYEILQDPSDEGYRTLLKRKWGEPVNLQFAETSVNLELPVVEG